MNKLVCFESKLKQKWHEYKLVYLHKYIYRKLQDCLEHVHNVSIAREH